MSNLKAKCFALPDIDIDYISFHFRLQLPDFRPPVSTFIKLFKNVQAIYMSTSIFLLLTFLNHFRCPVFHPSSLV